MENELHEALDQLLAADQELRRQKRALFPAVLARRRAASRVLEIWREIRGQPSADPPRPLLDRCDIAGADVAQVVEELPDGRELQLVGSEGTIAPPSGGWTRESLLEAARELLICDRPTESQLGRLVVCKRLWCQCLRIAPPSDRGKTKCPSCKGRSWETYGAVAGRFRRNSIDLVTSRPASTPTSNGFPSLEPDVTKPHKPQRKPRKTKPQPVPKEIAK